MKTIFAIFGLVLSLMLLVGCGDKFDKTPTGKELKQLSMNMKDVDPTVRAYAIKKIGEKGVALKGTEAISKVLNLLIPALKDEDASVCRYAAAALEEIGDKRAVGALKKYRDGLRKGLLTKMVLIPAGEFQMGDNFNEGDGNECPVHTVYLNAFYIDKYEVTNAQYADFLNAYGKNIDAAGHELLDIDSDTCLIEKVGKNIYQPKAGYENHPVIKVSWYGAAAYAQFCGKRLPTEAQWEKAARGGLVGKRYPWGDEITHDDANYDGTGGRDKWERTSPVGSFSPNGYGLYDVAGNVWEWCADEDDSGYYSRSPENNPKGPGVVVTFRNDDFTNVTSRRVLRGGGWLHVTYLLRCAFRNCIFNLTDTGVNLGFRCSQDQ